jgi:hypothetical protein
MLGFLLLGFALVKERRQRRAARAAAGKEAA